MNNLNKTNQKHPRQLERLSLFLVTVVLCLGFFTLYSNLEKQFEKAELGYKEQTVINLDKELTDNKLTELLITRDFVSDEKDAKFIAQHLTAKLAMESIPNLGALNLQRFRTPADTAFKYGGNGLKMQIEHSREILGITNEVNNKYSDTSIKDTFFVTGGNQCAIKVIVRQIDKSANWFQKNILCHTTKPVKKPVLVQLKEYYYDSLQVAKETIIGYALTNEKGMVSFTGLKSDGYYSVLPIKKGFEYGASKGTTQGTLGEIKEKNRTFIFTQREHQITPFDGLAYRQLKEDGALTVRTPGQFRNSFIPFLLFFFLAWWALHLFFCIRKKDIDQLLVPILMTLSGICLLVMYSITNPLVDKMLGNEMAKGVITGIILIAIISEIDFVKFFNSHYQWFGCFKHFKRFQNSRYFDIQFDFVLQFLNWLIKPYPQKIQQAKVKGKINFFDVVFFYLKCLFFLLCFPFEMLVRGICLLYKLLPQKLQLINLYEGSGYLLLALLLVGLLFPFGDGPEGSGVKVNLFFFQPSEIAKFLIIIFLSAFFVLHKRAEKIQAFSEKLTWKSFLLQGKIVIGVMISLVILLGIYLALGDMGPALVLTVTFIIMYSVARRDFPYLVLGTAAFVLMLIFGYKMGKGSTLIVATFALVWLVLWLIFGFIKPKRQLYESAVFMNLVIAVFMFGGSILTHLGFSHQGQRLQDRNDIYADVWSNDVIGGDQVVHGLWSLSSGGMSGQGLGEGNANLVPACHTDMIFTSIGEVLGWIGLLLIVLCMAILLHRSLLIGRKAGNPFVFYLATGIAIVTGVQFLVITLGCIGLIPLTGVAAPFLSYGKTSLIINLAAFAVILSISRIKAQEYQKTYQETYKWMVAYCSATYTIISIAIMVVLLWYQFFAQDTTLVRPALINNRQGKREVEYNPRINLLIKKIHAGDIYDRKNVLLATNNKQSINKQEIRDKIKAAGILEKDLLQETQKRKSRYYPLGNHMFFMIGDYNSRILWNDGETARGYMAERRHLADLRGFDNFPKQLEITAKIRPNRYLPAKDTTLPLVEYQYPQLIISMLKDGMNGKVLKKHNEKYTNRNINLTIDAKLQTQLQNAIKEEMGKTINTNSRVSVVILGAQSGELLCSANYPLPDQQKLRLLYDNITDNNVINENITERDLGMTFPTAPGSTAKVMSALASFRKYRKDAANITYPIASDEIIHTTPFPEPIGKSITLKTAIVESSNVYFVKLVNDKDIYPQLTDIYLAAGIRVDYFLPYIFENNISDKGKIRFYEKMGEMAAIGTSKYQDYVKSNKPEKMNKGYWQIAWGQGAITATPMAIARIASIVVNEGKLTETKYVLTELPNQKKQQIPEIVDKTSANILKNYMIAESKENKRIDIPGMGGKSGTPMRIVNKKNVQDGWYIFFIEKSPAMNGESIAAAVRIEKDSGGGATARFVKNIIVPKLKSLGYIE